MLFLFCNFTLFFLLILLFLPIYLCQILLFTYVIFVSLLHNCYRVYLFHMHMHIKALYLPSSLAIQILSFHNSPYFNPFPFYLPYFSSIALIPHLYIKQFLLISLILFEVLSHYSFKRVWLLSIFVFLPHFNRNFFTTLSLL